MSNILERITNTTLRRLYRFILKRLLGPFIADGDLSLDQISLTSRDGTVELTDLSLNCSYLNELLQKGNPAPTTAMELREVKVASIIAKISYSNILEDGISFTVSGVKIEVEPSQASSGGENINIDDIEVHSSSVSPSSRITDRDPMSLNYLHKPHLNQKVPSHESNDADALRFLSSWIEVIISKIRISVSDISVSIYDSSYVNNENLQDNTGGQLEVRSPILILSCRDIHFYNSCGHERHRMNESSVDLSFAAQNNRSSIYKLGNEKLLTIGDINGSVINKSLSPESSYFKLFEINGGCELRLSTTKKRFGTDDMDVNVSVPNLNVFISTYSIDALSMLSNHYCLTCKDSSKRTTVTTKTHTNNVMNLMKRLERLEGKEEDSEIDFERLSYFMEEYEKALKGLKLEQQHVGDRNKNHDGESEDEDVVFPESDNDEEDGEDMNDQSTMNMQSIYGADTFHSTMFKSTLEGPPQNNSSASNYMSNDNNRRQGNGSIHLRVHIISTCVELMLNHENVANDDTSDMIQMLCNTSIIDYVATETNTRTTFSVSKAVVADKESGSKLLEFFNERSARTIISSPDIEIEIKNDLSVNTFDTGRLHLTISLEPFALIMNPKRICTTMMFLSHLNFPEKSSPVHAVYHVKVVAKKVELLFVADDEIYEMSDSLRNYHELNTPNARRQIERWENKLPTFFQNNVPKSCGIRFSLVSGISSMVYITDGDIKLDHLRFDIIQVFLFVVSDNRGAEGYQLPFVKLLGGFERKLNVSWKHTTEGTKNAAPVHDDRFKFPDLDTDINNLKNTVVVECEKVMVDLWEAEYACCMSLVMKISRLLNVESKAGVSTQHQPSLGISIESNIFVANLSRPNPEDGNVTDLNDIDRYNKERDVNFYCLAAQNIELVVCATAKKANIRLHTGDFSLLESSSAFIDGEDSSYTPILFCTKHETQVDTPEQDAFRLSILLSDEAGMTLEDVVKHATVSLKLSDVTWHFDPQSKWITDISTMLGGEDDRKTTMELAKTQIYITVSNCVFDYSCKATKCRLLHAVEYLGLSSNMASNSTKIGFKVVLRNIRSYISRDLFNIDSHGRSMVNNEGTSKRRVVTPTFMSFLENHNFNTMYSVDICELRLLKDQVTGAMSVEVNIGFVNIGGCIDSYCALTDTMNYLLEQWLTRPKEVSEDDDRYVHESIEDNYGLHEGHEGIANSNNEIEQIFESGSKNQTVLQEDDDYSRGVYPEGKIVMSQGLQAAILDDFYKSSDLSGSYSETKAQWFPDYDYDDDDIDLGEITAKSDDEEDDNEGAGGFYEDNIPSTVTSSVISQSSEKSSLDYPSHVALFDVEMELEDIDSRNAKISNVTQLERNDSELLHSDEVDAKLNELKAQYTDRKSDLHEENTAAEVDTEEGVDREERGTEVEEFMGDNKVNSLDLSIERGVKSKRIAIATHINDEECEEGQNGGWYANVGDNKEAYYQDIAVENYVSDFSYDKSKSRGQSTPIETFVSIAMCIRIRLYDGSEENDTDYKDEQSQQASSTSLDEHHQHNFNRKSLFERREPDVKRPSRGMSGRANKDLLEISGKDTLLEFRLQHNKRRPSAQEEIRSDFEMNEPHQFLFLQVQDILVSFAKVSSKKKKVLGRWKYPSVESEDAAIKLTISTGSRRGVSDLQDLHILTLQVVPIRCYLDFNLISFIKRNSELAAISSISVNNKKENSAESEGKEDDAIPPGTNSAQVFFLFRIFSIRAKIDFRCGHFNINSLRGGDYSQMLNIFPLDGLEIDLQQIDLRRAVGVLETINKTLEIWVNDVYERQLHRVISGTAPLRGISRVGDRLQNLIYIPMSEFKKNGFNTNFMNSLKNSAGSFLHTVTTEALNASHQLTMILANGIKDLVSDDTSSSQQLSDTDTKQPQGIQESLGMAYGALERELGQTAETVVAVPIKQYERSGASGSIRCIIRAMPVAVLRPAAGLSEALSYTLLGLRNHLNPEAKVDADDAWDANHSMFITSTGTVTNTTHKTQSSPYKCK